MDADMFKLSRNGSNVPAEVQRWQYFLLKQKIPQVGIIDASFGKNTEEGTKIFQMQNGLIAHGRVGKNTLEKAAGIGYSILESDYYKNRSSVDWPPRPTNLKSPSNSWRNTLFECFEFIQKKRSQRPDAESIVIKGDCAETTDDWEEKNINNFFDDRLKFASGYRGYFRCHVKMVEPLSLLLDQWEKDDLLHLVLNYAGCYVPRYKRNQAPAGQAGHKERSSKDVDELSNHSFGSAIDISTTWNWLGETPAICGQKGSVRELVASANKAGFFWGGHYTGTKDGMHFELTKA